jgi:hypothetical protein
MTDEHPSEQLAAVRSTHSQPEARSEDGTQVLPTDSALVSAADPWKIAAAFQREIFRTQDSRLSHLDALGGIVVAAAIAVATFTGSLMKNEQVSIPGLVATGVLCGVTVAIALYARRERPKGRGQRGEEMNDKGAEAKSAVGWFQAKVRTRTLGDAAEAAGLEFDAWYALSESINARRKVKGLYFVWAIIALLLEVAAAIFSAYMSR